jgi:NitT/TauT family transport system substrate-binding protein
MATFRIMPHGRLQEWVAEEKGYFTDEGLEYEFVYDYSTSTNRQGSPGHGEPSGVREVRQGAFESMQAGRACDVSSACHWAVNMAASSRHGRMWGHCYSVTPSGIYVPPESPIRTSQDLADIEVAVGFHSGSHFSALQALEHCLPPAAIKLHFVGRPLERLALLLERQVASANIFGAPMYVLEQQGFRKIVDTTFMIGFLLSQETSESDVQRYFRALQRAQRDIDLQPERYKHYFLKALPEKYHSTVDLHAFGVGERLVFEPYTREHFEQTHRWMAAWDLFDSAAPQQGRADYAAAVLLLGDG